MPEREADEVDVKETVDEDIEETDVESLPIEDEVQEVSPEDLGFLQGRDIATSLTGAVRPQPQASVAQADVVHSRPDNYDIGVETKRSRGAGISSFFSSVGSIFSGIKIPTFGMRGAGVLGIAGVGLVLALILGGILYWYLPKATVTVFVAPKKLEKTLKLTVDPKLSVINQAEKIIPGESKEVSVTGEKTASTTGSRTVGDRAKGQVTIYHIGGSTVLKSGLALTGSGGLKFTLDSDVTVASSSGITSPSKTQAAVTAADIGAQYNLASGSKFAVGNFSKDSFEAQNDNALSGGTSRSVSAVSEEDRANLEKELTQELLSRGLEDLEKSLSENEVLIADAASLDADTKTFSHKTGEEASTLKLSLSGKVSVTVAPKDAVNSLIMADLEKDVPSGFALRQDQVQVNYKVEKPAPPKKTTTKTQTAAEEEEKPATGGALNLNAEVVANLLPKVNPDETARAIAGKYPEIAREYLATIPGFTRAEISLSIKLPGKLGTLPRIAKNIIVEVASER